MIKNLKNGWAVAALLMVCITFLVACDEALELTSSSSGRSAAPAQFADDQKGAPLKASEAASYLSASFANKQNDFASASQFLREIAGDEDIGDSLLQQEIVLQIMNGDFHNAFKANFKLLQDNPDDNIANQLYALELIKGGRFEAALDVWNRTAEAHAGQIIKPVALAWNWAGLKEKTQAMAELDKLKPLTGFEVFAAINKALILNTIGEKKEAIQAFEKALSMVNVLSQRLVILAYRFYDNYGMTDAANGIIQTFLAQNPGVEESFIHDLLSYDLQPNPPLSAAQGLAEALYDIALIFDMEDRPRQGLYYAQLARYLSPQSPFMSLLVADLYTDLGLYDRAARLYEQPNLFPPSFDWLVQFKRANTLYRAGEEDAAIAAFKALDKKDPKRVQPLTSVAEIYQRQEKHGKAVAVLTTVLERLKPIQPQDWYVLYQRGISYEQSGQWDKAQEDLELALDLNPEEPFLLNYLGYSWIDRGENIEQAKEYVKKAALLQPTNGYIIDSLGWAMYKLGEYDVAVHYLEKAVKLRPQDPVILDHLADAYWQVGRLREAQFLWKQVLSFKPDDKLKQAVQDKIEKGL